MNALQAATVCLLSFAIQLGIVVLPASVWVRSLRPWGMLDRSPMPRDANCPNWQKNSSGGAAMS